MADTPNLHLTLGPDADANRNWQILDDVMWRLGRGVQIPDDLNILGSLDVRDNLHVGGDATIDGTTNLQHLNAGGVANVQSLVAAGQITGAGGLFVTAGPIALPDLSIDGTDFMRMATIQTVQVSTPNTALLAIPVAPGAVLNSLDMSADDDGRIELVIAQTSLQIGLAADAAVNGSVSYALKRGSDGSGVSVQTRAFQYAFTRAQTLTFPITIVRVGVPVAADQRRWSLVATASTTPAPATLTQTFTQIHALQFR